MGAGMQEAAEEGEFAGARLDAGLRAARFASPPSADVFGTQVEPKNVPAVNPCTSRLPKALLCCHQVLTCSPRGGNRVVRCSAAWPRGGRPPPGGILSMAASTTFWFPSLLTLVLLRIFATIISSSSNCSLGKSGTRCRCGSYDVGHWACVLWRSQKP